MDSEDEDTEECQEILSKIQNYAIQQAESFKPYGREDLGASQPMVHLNGNSIQEIGLAALSTG